MSLRIFRDSAGVEWRVWDVAPESIERRHGERGKHRDVAFRGTERRRPRGTRVSGPAAMPRVRVREGYETGWLAFEALAERRRLAPIPPGWEAMSEHELEALWRYAKVVGARSERSMKSDVGKTLFSPRW